MNQQKKNEIFAFFWFVVSVLTLVSLLSYTPDDIALDLNLIERFASLITLELNSITAVVHDFIGLDRCGVVASDENAG